METETTLWTTADVAGYLRICEAAVQQLVEGAEGLPHLSIAGHLRFRKEDVERWVDLQVSGAPQPPARPTPPPAVETTDLIRGYRVKVEYHPPTEGGPSVRTAVAAVIARSILRRQEEANRSVPQRQKLPSFADRTGA
jgi:hypothetical protein